MSVDHYENFPVASILCPPSIRPAVAAIYHFARTADDIADEGTAEPEARLADLKAYRQDLLAGLAGENVSARWPGVFSALTKQVRAFDLPVAPLKDLLDAFEQDARNPSYATREELLDYCRRSANPIGRLLLHLYGIQDAQSLRQSDAICTALQLINFWQDLSVDIPRGRHYVCAADAHAHAVTNAELHAGSDSPRARALVRSLVDWAEDLMKEGQPLALRVPGRAGWELRLVVQGGLAILEKIRDMNHASLLMRPTLRPWDLPKLLWRAWRMGGDSA